jgi:molybdopterin/thiamine biosynthesis adenylyltransferase
MATQGNALAGCLAASLQAVEIGKLVAGDLEHVAAGREVLFDASSHSLVVSRLVRNPACRFAHERWSVRSIGDLTLRAALALGGGASPAPQLFVPDEAFVSKLSCADCGFEEASWRLRQGMDQRVRRCPLCGSLRDVRGFDLFERIAAAQVPGELLDRPLSERGLRAGEIFGVQAEGARAAYFALGKGCGCDESQASSGGGATLVVGGLGNIGSYLQPLLARTPGVERVVLCDFDTYEAHQIAGQDIELRAVGRNKAEVQAERLRAIRPELHVEAFVAPVETLPMGMLLGAIVVSCLDSLAARLRLAARAWRVGSPFVDAGVGGGTSLLARTTVYLPEEGAACFQCGLDIDDYAALEQIQACAGSARAAAA